MSSINRFFKLVFNIFTGGQQDFTTGNIDRAILMLSVPVIIEMFGEGLFALVDMFYVSQVSVNAIAVVTITESMMFIIFSVAMGIAMATSAVVARRVGEKAPEKASHTTRQAIYLALALGSLIGLIGYNYTPELLTLMGAEPEVIDEGMGFTQIMFASNAIIMLLFIINGAFRGAGNSAVAMWVLLGANALNIVLDPIFIFGWGPIPAYGVKGAAIATTTGRSLAVLAQFFVLFNGHTRLKLFVNSLKVDFQLMKEILKISVGGTGQFLIESVSWLVLMGILAHEGNAQVAGFGIGFRIIAFSILPSWGLAQAAAALVGQNLGAEKPDRAEKSVIRSAIFNVIFLLFVSISFFLGSEYIVSEYFTKDLDVIKYATLTLKVVCSGYIFFAVGMVVSQAFNGAGDTVTPTIINIFCFLVVQLPLAYVLTQVYSMGILGVLICIAACHSLQAVISALFFRKGTWKLNKV